MHSLMRRDLTDIKKAVCINSDIIDQKKYTDRYYITNSAKTYTIIQRMVCIIIMYLVKC